MSRVAGWSRALVAVAGAATLAVGVAVASPTASGPGAAGGAPLPAVLLDHGHDARRGDANLVLSGTLTYVESPGCFVLRGSGPAIVPTLAELPDPPPRPVVWPDGTRGVRVGERVGVRTSAGRTFWAGQAIEATGTPVADVPERLPASVGACRSTKYVVLENVTSIAGPPTTAGNDFRVVGVPIVDPDLPWIGGAGKAVSRDTLSVFTGHPHCDWESLTFLAIGSGPTSVPPFAQYVRDPFGLFADREAVTFDAHARLPSTARSTGWRQQGDELWLSADAAYVVFADRVEQWPRLTALVGCL